MFVKDYMTRHPIMASPNMSLVEAQRYMGASNVRHLPVVGDGKRLLGLITRQSFLIDPGRLGSLDLWEITRYMSGMTLKDVMLKREAVVTVSPDIAIEDAAYVMVEHKIGCLPVVEDGILVGILTETDMLTHLMGMLATREAGVRVTVRMANVRGELAKLIAAIGAHGWGILACGGTLAPKDPTYWDAVLKIADVSMEEVKAVLETLPGQQVLDMRDR
jgi:acetoin utilization protein AcuB